MADLAEPKEFRPVLLSRRGELIAWTLATVTIITFIIVRTRSSVIPFGASILAVFFLLAALSITLSNWMDRNTVIRLDGQAIFFGNGLRKVRLGWDEIKSVQITPSNFGDRVYVRGEGAQFRFRKLGQVEYQGEVKGQMGFIDGEQILSLILSHSKLLAVNGESSGSYYAPS
jgi:hypothetical protein